MKLMIASDIHGSAYHCKRLIAALEREKPDKLVLLGDLLYHGPRNELPRDYAPKEVIAMLSAHREQLLCVRGNCDTEVDQTVLPFPILADYCLLYIGGYPVFATHGHNHNEQQLPPLQSGSVLLHGHTHIPACRVHESYVYLNPGSVSIPKEGSPHSYMVWSDRLIEWKTTDGEVYHSILSESLFSQGLFPI